MIRISNPGFCLCVINITWLLLNPNRCASNQCVFNHFVINQGVFKPLCSILFCPLEILCNFDHKLQIIDPRNCKFINVVKDIKVPYQRTLQS